MPVDYIKKMSTDDREIKRKAERIIREAIQYAYSDIDAGVHAIIMHRVRTVVPEVFSNVENSLRHGHHDYIVKVAFTQALMEQRLKEDFCHLI